MRVRMRAILGASKEASQPGGPNVSGTRTTAASHSASMGTPDPSRRESALGVGVVKGLRRLNGLFPTTTVWPDTAAGNGVITQTRPVSVAPPCLGRCLPLRRWVAWRRRGAGRGLRALVGVRQERVMATRIWRDELIRLIRDEAAQLVEVLPPPEYEDEHIEGAISIPLKNLDREAKERLDPGRPVVVY